MKRSARGFTLIEVLIAVIVLGVGVVALASSSAMVTRMIGRGKMATRASQVASQRLEVLRLLAYSTTPKCTSGQFANGTSASNWQGVTEKWIITASGSSRTIVDSVKYNTASGGTHTDVLTTIIEC